MASVLVASLAVSRYEKTQNFVAFVNELWLMEKKKWTFFVGLGEIRG